jgi:hypothetical protein
MIRVVADYFRTGGSLPRFELTGPLSERPGFFSFGSGGVCYGKSSSALMKTDAVEPLHDVMPDTNVDAGVVRLPLDPDEIVESLRLERYQRDGLVGNKRSVHSPSLRDVYYGLRRFLPIAIRKHLQRVVLKDWRDIVFPKWPVDDTVEQILRRLLALSMRAQGLQKVPFIWFWPDGAKSCAVMTHDVETRSGRNFCSRLMDLDDSAKIKSSFQIVPEERYAVPTTLLAEMRAREFEINVHDLNHDGHLFSDYRTFLRRANRINAYGRTYGARGFRSGGLYRNFAWYDALEFSYDMSFPNTGRLDPQRGGCCTLMPFFIGRILELPLTTTQDYTLFHILNDYSIDLWRRQFRAIEAQHGLITFLVHPDYVIEKRARATYQGLLEHLTLMRQERRTWIALPNEVDHWWRLRNQMRLVGDNDRPHIEGEGKERARLAFAYLTGDTVTFTHT